MTSPRIRVENKRWLCLIVFAAFLAVSGCGDSKPAPQPAPLPTPLCVARPAGLVSWWKGQANAQDTLGSHNGTITGNVTFANAEVGQGFVFDGTALINVGSVTGTTLDIAASDFTLEFWLKTSSDLSSGLGELIAGDAGLGQAQGFRVLYQPTVNHQLRFRIADSSSASVVDTPPINDGMWHHYAFVRSGGNLIAYVDGVSSATTPTTITDITSTAEFQIGGRTPGASTAPDSFFDGSLDELSFYSRALSATEISGIFAAGVNGKC